MSLHIGALVRMIPSAHRRGALPPVPPAGLALRIRNVVRTFQATILASQREAMTLKVDDLRWHLTPLRPTEMHLALSYPEHSGAIDWVVRG